MLKENVEYEILSEMHPAAGEEAGVRCRWAAMYDRPVKRSSYMLFSYKALDFENQKKQTGSQSKFYLGVKPNTPLIYSLHELEKQSFLSGSVDVWETVKPRVILSVLTGFLIVPVLMKSKQVTKYDEDKWYENACTYLKQTSGTVGQDLIFISKKAFEQRKYKFAFEFDEKTLIDKFLVDLDALTDAEREMYERQIFSLAGSLTGRVAFDSRAYCWFEMRGYHLPERITNTVGWVRETAIKYESMESVQAWIDAQRRKLFPELYPDTSKFSIKDILKWAAIAFGAYKIGGG
ncbi:MAG: hypothetical protein LBS01_04950 [Prevotellaceae bacterium]|jgi:hypothetical protein|nr:hypothetical protein [Prevotellaceae bacterium]